MRILLGILLLGCALPLLHATPAFAGGSGDCYVETNLEGTTSTCEVSPDEAKDLANTDDSDYSVTLKSCKNIGALPASFGSKCDEGFRASALECGDEGSWYWLFRNKQFVGNTCLEPNVAEQMGQVSPGMVFTAFQKLSWPAAELVIQPPQGKTLVNLETLFYAKSPGAQRQQVTLLGQPVTIEATPTSYTWHADQGGESWVTGSPSRAFRKGDDAASMNHFVYHDADTTVAPSVDVTYSGRFRVGSGQWFEIPGTLTVAGTPTQLRVVEATPLLTDAGG